MSVGVVLVNYHTARLTHRVIDSILRFDRQKLCSVVVVDNSVCNQERKRLLMSNNDSVDYIFSEDNIGFGRACNLGAKQILRRGIEYLFFINTDVIITNPIIYEVVKILSCNDDVHLVSPLIQAHPVRSLKPWFSRATISRWNGKIKDAAISLNSEMNDTDFISGCFMALRSKDWLKLGGFDERFFMYVEDVEFSLRARMSGMNLAIIPQLEILHEVGGSQKTKTEIRGLSVQNQNFLFHFEHKFHNRLILYSNCDYFYKSVYIYWLIDLSWKSIKFLSMRPKEVGKLFRSLIFIFNGTR